MNLPNNEIAVIDVDAILQSMMASLPEIVLLLAACTLIMIDLICKGRRVELIAGLSILTILVVAALTLGLALHTTFGTDPVYNHMFIADPFSVFFKILFYIATIISILFSGNYLKNEGQFLSEYFIILLFALCGMMIMASATDLISVYVGLELLALSLYVLTGFLKHNERSNESALKYLILSAVATCLMLYGVSLFYGLTGTTQLGKIAAILDGSNASTDSAYVLASLFLIAGFAFKIAAVPFHMWAPDVYEGAPTPITAFMSVAPKAAGFAVLLRIFNQALPQLSDIWLPVLATIALASLTIGSLVALVQTNIKRLLAYSSIAHAGFALLGLVAGGESGTASVMLYLLIYAFMNLGIFAVVIAMQKAQGRGELIEDFTGLSKQHPVIALLMLLFLFSLTGIPPTAGFMAKLYIILALVNSGYILLAVAAVLFSAIAAFFYLRIVMLMYMREPNQNIELHLSPGFRFSLAVTGIATLGVGLMPRWFFEMVSVSVF